MMLAMEWLNYHHLYYFWIVAREGSIAKACEELRLAQPTISGQLRMLEEDLGEQLFRRAGRGLVLTDVGHMVYRYAEEIFSLGREIKEVVRGAKPERSPRLVVGVTEVLPKLVAYRLLEPALQGTDPIQLVCWEGKLENLLAELAIHRLDLVLADAPLPPMLGIRAYSHQLIECGVSIMAPPGMAPKYRRRFPRSLNGAPFLLPTDNTVLRRSLEHWFENHAIHPKVVGEFEDSALLKAFGQAGCGIFAIPTLIEAEVQRQYRVRLIGRAPTIRERFYAISIERKIKHPAVRMISQAAQGATFEAKG
jgi:LysR family transcriptional regulator, transcriptional activator of nhaA